MVSLCQICPSVAHTFCLISYFDYKPFSAGIVCILGGFIAPAIAQLWSYKDKAVPEVQPSPK